MLLYFTRLSFLNNFQFTFFVRINQYFDLMCKICFWYLKCSHRKCLHIIQQAHISVGFFLENSELPSVCHCIPDNSEHSYVKENITEYFKAKQQKSFISFNIVTTLLILQNICNPIPAPISFRWYHPFLLF